jgi:hypothetical protein
MDHLIDIDTRDKDNLPELQLAEEQFLDRSLRVSSRES